MIIRPLAAESLGTRALSVLVKTGGKTIIVDPGVSLGPKRYGYRPHKREYRALKEQSNSLLAHSENTDVLVVSHYHFDHYMPSFENYKYNWSSGERAQRLFSNKIVYAKDRGRDINYSQRKRSYYLEELCGEVSHGLEYVDGETVKDGGLTIEFSPAVSHGPRGTKLGYVLMTAITRDGFTFIHSSDVQGPVVDTSREWMLARSPDLIMLGGPPLYLVPHRFTREDLNKARENMMDLARHSSLIVDHHLMRSSDYREFIQPIRREAESHGNTVKTSAEYLGRDNKFLEAHREELHGEEPVEEEFYQRIEEGYYVDEPI